MTAGPGAYEHERSTSQTKTRTVNTLFSKTKARPESFAKSGDIDVSPGQYNDKVRFNSNSKSFTIGEKRVETVRETMGPGAYSPEKADAVTRTKQVSIRLGSSPARPASFARGGDIDVAPGQYDSGKKFGEDTKTFKIGEKRETRIEQTVGPGTYDHAKADELTKTKSVRITMGSSPSRPDTFAKANTDVAPG